MIVIIIVLAIVFALPFLTDTRDIESLNEQYLKLKADNTLAALLATTIPDCTTMKEELSQCSISNQPSCFDNCEQLNSQIERILTASLPQNSYFNLKVGEKTLVESTQGTCLNTITSTQQTINQETGAVFSICF